MIAAALLFLSLGLDTLAVALGLGLAGLPRPQWRRVGLTFALFEGLMPVVGLLAGDRLSRAAGAWAGYAAAGLLILVGALAIREAAAETDEDEPDLPTLEGRRLALAGLSVSLDELAVGFSLGVLRVPIGPALLYITVQAFALTYIGLSLGRRVGRRLGENAEMTSGIVLTLLGIALLVSQATGRHFLWAAGDRHRG